MNKSKIYSRPYKYGGYVKIDDSMYKKLGLGDWLGDNAANILKTVAGGVLTAIPGTQAAGIPLLASGVTGMATDGIQAKSNRVNEASIAKQNQITKLNNQLEAEYMKEKGGYINYNKGSKHSDPLGGIPVDKMGNPVITSKQKPAAVTEKGEVTYVFPDGRSLVLSEVLGDVKKFNSIKNNYKLRLGNDLKGHDTISRGGLLKDMNNLAEEITARNKPKETEGGLPIAQNGGEPWDPKIYAPWESKYSIIPLRPDAQSMNPNTQNPVVANPVNNPIANNNIKTSTGTKKVSTNPLTEIKTTNFDNTDYSQQINDDIYSNFTPPSVSDPKIISSEDLTGAKEQGELYNPIASAAITAGIGGAATILGNLAMAKKYKAPKPTNPKLVNAPTVSFEAERQAARDNATIARNSGISTIRNTGATRGSLAANSAGIATGVQKNLNQSLSQSYQNEENTNKQLSLSVDEMNAQSINRDNQFNAYRKDQYDYNKLPFYQGALGSIQGMTNDISQASNMRDYLSINSGRTGYEVRRNPITKKLEMVPVKGFFERIKQ